MPAYGAMGRLPDPILTTLRQRRQRVLVVAALWKLRPQLGHEIVVIRTSIALDDDRQVGSATCGSQAAHPSHYCVPFAEQGHRAWRAQAAAGSPSCGRLPLTTTLRTDGGHAALLIGIVRLNPGRQTRSRHRPLCGVTSGSADPCKYGDLIAWHDRPVPLSYRVEHWAEPVYEALFCSAKDLARFQKMLRFERRNISDHRY